MEEIGLVATLAAIVIVSVYLLCIMRRRRLRQRYLNLTISPYIGNKRSDGYAIATIIIVAAFVIFITNLNNLFPPLIGPPYYERIDMSATVTKSTHTYTVTINFVNTGSSRTGIDSVLLNGVPYDDPAWAGTLMPVVYGDITPKTVINVGVAYSGTITFSDDCTFTMSGNKLMPGVIVTITIHTTGLKDYNISLTLP